MESFQANRLARTVNLLLQSLLMLLLFVGLNYLGMKYFKRNDLTQGRIYSLSAETTSYLSMLKEPVKVVVTLINEEGDADMERMYREVRSVLREFAYATRDNASASIDVEFLNVYQQRRRAELLGVEEPNVVLFMAGEKRKAVFPNDLYKTEDRKPGGFQGEKAAVP